MLAALSVCGCRVQVQTTKRSNVTEQSVILSLFIIVTPLDIRAKLDERLLV